MDLLEQIINCKTDEEADLIIKDAIDKTNKQTAPIEQLGFLDVLKSVNVYEGFIPLKTRIKYDKHLINYYSMETTDFFYDFAHAIRKYGLNSKRSIIRNIELFLNSYFGHPGKNNREDIFTLIAFNSTITDEEYFAALDNNKIGDLKGKGAAECTERGAVAQQLLSLFGIKTYYCMGCVNLGDRQYPHCFNIVKRKNDYALLDYSLYIISYNNDGTLKRYEPFIGILSNEEFLDFINNGLLKSFENYYYIEKKPKIDGTQRQYIVGEFEIEKGKSR